MDEYEGIVDYGEGASFVPTAFGGHCLYVRRCVTGDADDQPHEHMALNGARMIGGVMIHGVRADNSCTMEVLGWGRKLDERCSIGHARKYRQPEIEKFIAGGSTEQRAEQIARGVYVNTHDIEIGTLLLLPLPWPCVDERVIRSPIVDTEAFIESSLPIYVWEDD